jgi:hypothetical protein
MQLLIPLLIQLFISSYSDPAIQIKLLIQLFSSSYSLQLWRTGSV